MASLLQQTKIFEATHLIHISYSQAITSPENANLYFQARQQSIKSPCLMIIAQFFILLESQSSRKVKFNVSYTNASMASQEDIVWQAARRPFKQSLFLSNAAFPQAQGWRHKPYTHKSHSCGSITSWYLFLKLSPYTQQWVHQARSVSSSCTLHKEQIIPFAQ